MTETVVLARCHFADGLMLWPFQVFTQRDPELVARLHLRALIARFDHEEAE